MATSHQAVTWHIEPHAAHRALMCRGFVGGNSYEKRSPFQAVCTILVQPDGMTGEINGMKTDHKLRPIDFVSLLSELRKQHGLKQMVAERNGRVVMYDTETCRPTN